MERKPFLQQREREREKLIMSELADRLLLQQQIDFEDEIQKQK